MHFEPI